MSHVTLNVTDDNSIVCKWLSTEPGSNQEPNMSKFYYNYRKTLKHLELKKILSHLTTITCMCACVL